MGYEEAVELLENALVFGIDPSLEPIRAICEELGQPQEEYRCIQVAGTNGKTSTARLTAALLRAQGKRAGLYTSPHLVRYPERIEVDGHIVSDELFARGIAAAHDASVRRGIQATEFELLTAAALWIFAQEGVDWAVLECGLGGRWDATSVVEPRVAVITGVGLDHTHILGDTVEQVAAEKAAIIKEGSCAVFAEDLTAREVFEAAAEEHQVPYAYAARASVFELPAGLMIPSYQEQNIATAIASVTAALGHVPTRDAVLEALEMVELPGRFEAIQRDPLVIIDAAHNPQSARTLAQELPKHFRMTPSDDTDAPPLPALLIGVLADKDARGIVRALVPLFDRVVVTSSSSSRSIPARDLARIVMEECGVNPEVADTLDDAFKLLRNDSLIATGSITVAGEVKDIWC